MVLYQLHLPSEVRIFKYNSEPTHADSHAVVMDSVAIEDDTATYCRGYYFLDRWLSVFITFDERLELKADASHTFPFAFNCDITTPHYYQDDSVFTTDLYVDILVGTDGRTYQIEDVEDFQQAFALGVFGKGWYDNAKRGLDWLIGLLEHGQFVNFLNEVDPFPDTKPNCINPIAYRRHLSEVDFKHHPRYSKY